MRSLGTLALAWLVLLCTSTLRAQPDPVFITKQPAGDVNAVRGKRFTLSVEATGTDLRYRWYSNSIALVAQTNATLVWTSNVPATTYYVIISNVISAVRSSNSVVKTIPDTFGPRILSVLVRTGEPNRVYVYFDEDILRVNLRNPEKSGTNTMNYVVTDTATGERPVVSTAAVAAGIGAARLTFAENLDLRKAYELCVYNISDLRTNHIALNSCGPVGFEILTNLFTYGSYWSFYDWVDAPPADWYEPDYFEDPMLWGNGPGMFYHDLSGGLNPPCTLRGWALSVGPGAYYFRKRFSVPANILNEPLTAIINRVVDDGMVVYLNGTEIMRTNLPSDSLTHASRALGQGNPNVCGTNENAITGLLRQTNVLAVAVYQVDGPDFDMAFDTALSIKHTVTPVLTNRPPSGDVFLRHSNHSPTELRLYWTNGMGFALEYVDSLGDQWRELQPPSTNVIVDKSDPTRFYRLNKRH